MSTEVAERCKELEELVVSGKELLERLTDIAFVHVKEGRRELLPGELEEMERLIARIQLGSPSILAAAESVAVAVRKATDTEAKKGSFFRSNGYQPVMDLNVLILETQARQCNAATALMQQSVQMTPVCTITVTIGEIIGKLARNVTRECDKILTEAVGLELHGEESGHS